MVSVSLRSPVHHPRETLRGVFPQQSEHKGRDNHGSTMMRSDSNSKKYTTPTMTQRSEGQEKATHGINAESDPGHDDGNMCTHLGKQRQRQGTRTVHHQDWRTLRHLSESWHGGLPGTCPAAAHKRTQVQPATCTRHGVGMRHDHATGMRSSTSRGTMLATWRAV